MQPVAKNILFIMCDQLRFDYLSCAGHPFLKTPNIDKLAARGVRFTHAYVQSPVCGASRMSFYTGRYVDSHGAAWNNFPLKVGEMTMGDYLRPMGMDTVLVGKTHMKADVEGMERLGIHPESLIGVRVSECGFDPFERDDGLHPIGPAGRYSPKEPRYNQYLRDKGYISDNPWHDFANSARGDDNALASGWAMRHARKPARVAEEDSETPYMTRRAMDFIEQADDKPWCLHLSYIKPHWPYIAPEPYNSLFGAEHVVPVMRSPSELVDPHPVFAAFMEHRVGKTFSKDQVREEVIPVYMGLIKQIDDQLGVLFSFMAERGLMDDTLIVFTADHGDYLGDHWLGEKDMLHEPSVKVPMIVYDPSAAADATRGSVCDALVESIDLLPTFYEVAGGKVASQSHRMEGRSLLPLLHGKTPDNWRRFAISEYDYSALGAGGKLRKTDPSRARLFMVADHHWKLIHAEGFRPMLFDLKNDPQEFNDLGADPAHAVKRDELMQVLYQWGLRLSQRTTISDETIISRRGAALERGVIIGVWDEGEIADHYWDTYRGASNT